MWLEKQLRLEKIMTKNYLNQDTKSEFLKKLKSLNTEIADMRLSQNVITKEEYARSVHKLEKMVDSLVDFVKIIE